MCIDNDSRLSDSDPDPGNDNDRDSSEPEQSRSSMTKHRAWSEAALVDVQEGGQVLGLDLSQVPMQNSGRSTCALECGPGRNNFLTLAA